MENNFLKSTMVAAKFLVCLALVAVVNCRYIILEDISDHIDLEDYMLDKEVEEVHPIDFGGSRVRRQAVGVLNTNPDGSLNIQGKARLAGNNANSLNGLAGVNALQGNGKFGTASAGLAFENHNGHGASLTGTHVPGFANQLTAAGKLGLVNTDAHKLSANAFVTKNMPTIPNVPNFNTHGGSLNYLYNDKIGGSLGVAKTPFLQRTDVSAMGNLNLLRSPTTSLDFSAGASKSFSPFMPSSRWQPTGGLSFSKYF